MTTFDRLIAEAAPLVQAGLHQRDSPPVAGGRWPVSVVLRPDHASAERLERVMAEVEGLAGTRHFRTGIAGSVHFTVRVLEGYRELVGEHDEVIQRYARAMSRAAWQVGAIDLGRTTIQTAELVRFRYEDSTDGRLMRPEVLASVRTGSSHEH